MKAYTLMLMAVAIVALAIFLRARKNLYIANGNIIVKGLFRRVTLDPVELKSISRTTDLTSRIFQLSMVVVETRQTMFSVYTPRITDKKWNSFIEELK
jgi:hypothetical protein